MAISLTKATPSFNLTKDAAVAATARLGLGAGWDPVSAGAKPDLDLVLICTDSNNKMVGDSIAFFNQLEIAGVKHTGDNRTGDGDGDDELAYVNLAELPAEFVNVHFYVVSYAGADLSAVGKAFVRCFKAEGTDEEVVRIDIDGQNAEADAGNTALFAGTITRGADGLIATRVGTFEKLGQGDDVLNAIIAKYS